MYALLLILGLAGATVQVEPDFQYDVLRSRPLPKDEPGQLRIDGSGIEYRSVNGKTSIRVAFIDIREMDLSDPGAIRIETYEILKRKLAGRRTYEFRLRSSRSIQDNDRLVKFVSDRVRVRRVGNPKFRCQINCGRDLSTL